MAFLEEYTVKSDLVTRVAGALSTVAPYQLKTVYQVFDMNPLKQVESNMTIAPMP